MPGVKVLACCDSPLYSGAEIFFVRVVTDLERRDDIDLTVAAPAGNAALASALTAGGIAKQRILQSPGQPLRLAAFRLLDPRRVRRAAHLLRTGDYDVLLLNISSCEHGTLPLFTDAGQAMPSVGLVHLHQKPHSGGARLGKTRARLARMGMQRLDTACTLSDAAARFTAEHWLSAGATVEIVPMPEPKVERIAAGRARDLLGLERHDVLLGFAGRLVFGMKGLDVFLDAAFELARTRPSVHFVIAGEGEDGARAADRIRARAMDERFSLLGRVDDMGVFLSAIDALVIPSRAEGLPLVALEALSLECPGIACGVDGLLDVWPRSWQVPPAQPELLARAISALLDAPAEEVRTTSAEGRELARRHTAADLGPRFASILANTARRRLAR